MSVHLWIAIAVLTVFAVVAELVLGRLFDLGFKPIDQFCRRLPRRVQITLMIFLLVIATGAWIYGCTRSGF